MLYERLARPVLFKLGRGDAEQAHETTLRSLERVARHPSAIAALRTTSGVDFSQYRDTTIKRRTARRCTCSESSAAGRAETARAASRRGQLGHDDGLDRHIRHHDKLCDPFAGPNLAKLAR